MAKHMGKVFSVCKNCGISEIEVCGIFVLLVILLRHCLNIYLLFRTNHEAMYFLSVYFNTEMEQVREITHEFKFIKLRVWIPWFHLSSHTRQFQVKLKQCLLFTQFLPIRVTHIFDKSTFLQVLASCRQATKLLPEPMLTQIYVVIWRHWATMAVLVGNGYLYRWIWVWLYLFVFVDSSWQIAITCK